MCTSCDTGVPQGGEAVLRIQPRWFLIFSLYVRSLVLSLLSVDGETVVLAAAASFRSFGKSFHEKL